MYHFKHDIRTKFSEKNNLPVKCDNHSDDHRVASHNFQHLVNFGSVQKKYEDNC